MPDINLLDDTQTPEEGGTKARPDKPRVQYSAPAPGPKPEPEPRLPSSFWVRVRSWFAPKPSIRQPVWPKQEKPLEPIIKSVEPESPIHQQPRVNQAVSTQAPVPDQSGVGPVSAAAAPPQRPAGRSLRRPDRSAEESSEGFMVNLLPDELAGKVNPRQKLMRLGIVVIASVALVVIAAGGLAFYRSRVVKKTENVRAQRTSVEAAILTLRDEQRTSLKLQEETQAIANLMNQHVYWTKFFRKLERYTDPEVVFSGTFAGDLKGRLSMQASAKNFRALARQLLIFSQAKDFVTDAVTTSATSSDLSHGEIVSFGIELTLASDIFTQTSEEFKAANPNISNPLSPEALSLLSGGT